MNVLDVAQSYTKIRNADKEFPKQFKGVEFSFLKND